MKSVSDKEKKRLKAEYDREYRSKNRTIIKKKKAAYFQLTYNPARAAIERKKTMPRHVEYCRQPKYKEYKKNYDEQHRAKKWYGEFFESAIVLKNVKKEIDNFRAKQDNNLINKSQTRRRKWQSQQ